MNHCLATEGCLAVNFLRHFKPSCELTSKHVNTGDLADHNNSDVYVVGRYMWLLSTNSQDLHEN